MISKDDSRVTVLPENKVSEQLKTLSGTLKFPDITHEAIADISNVVLQLRALDNLMYDFFAKYGGEFNLLSNEEDSVHCNLEDAVSSVTNLYHWLLFESDIEY